MLFGLVAAAIAGFLLTSTPVWTGRPALCGRPLMTLFAVWTLGRLAMLGAGRLPAGVVAAVDLAFLPLLAAVLARTLWRTGQRRNYGIVALVGVLALANAAVHAQALGFTGGSAPRALRFTADLVIVLIVVIGGRITPGFTTNALIRLGVDARAASQPWLDRLAVSAVIGLAAVDLVAPRSVASGVLAAAAGLAVAARMTGWQTLRTWRDPLVWSLHAGMAWVAVGLLLVAAGDLGRSRPPERRPPRTHRRRDGLDDPGGHDAREPRAHGASAGAPDGRRGLVRSRPRGRRRASPLGACLRPRSIHHAAHRGSPMGGCLRSLRHPLRIDPHTPSRRRKGRLMIDVTYSCGTG